MNYQNMNYPELKFPDLKFIKSHKRHPNPKNPDDYEEYEWDIFNIDYFGFIRIKYNEDDNGKLYLDIVCQGYTDRWQHDGFNRLYEANAEEYKKLKETAQGFVKEIIDGISVSNEDSVGHWE